MAYPTVTSFPLAALKVTVNFASVTFSATLTSPIERLGSGSLSVIEICAWVKVMESPEGDVPLPLMPTVSESSSKLSSVGVSVNVFVPLVLPDDIVTLKFPTVP